MLSGSRWGKGPLSMLLGLVREVWNGFAGGRVHLYSAEVSKSSMTVC
jgi:hypothetical protein